MFTGIVQGLGKIASIDNNGEDRQLSIDMGSLDINAVTTGDSIAVNGVCLTAISTNENTFLADVSIETLNLTTLGALRAGTPVNLELALMPTSRLGGHLVSGHVDGRGEVIERFPDARSERYTFRVPHHLSRYIAAKGSVCIEGVSLTVNTVNADLFSVNIVPHTQQATTLGDCRPGALVNIEIDVIARYLERLLENRVAQTPPNGISEPLLRDTGFIDAGD